MTTADVQALIRSDIAKREIAAKKNREAFPFAAELMDMFAEFEPKLIYAEQGDKTIGRKPDETNNMDAYRLLDMHDTFERMKSHMRKKK